MNAGRRNSNSRQFVYPAIRAVILSAPSAQFPSIFTIRSGHTSCSDPSVANLRS